jgi:hypothetical protein
MRQAILLAILSSLLFECTGSHSNESATDAGVTVDDSGTRSGSDAMTAGGGDAGGHGGIDAGTTGGVDAGTTGGVDAATTGGGGIWHPASGTTWQWQLTGTIDTTVAAAVYDIDLVDAPQTVIDKLHTDGRKVICYFSAGTYENWRPDASQFPTTVLGSAVAGWPGENWLDTRSATVRTIMSARLDLAVTKRCDGVEPDNVDGYMNSPGFPLTAMTQLDFNTFLATQAHQRGLSVGLKNDLDQVGSLVTSFDWALNEECSKYSECGLLQPFVAAGKAAFHCEYTTSCPTAVAGLSTILKTLALGAPRTVCP